MTNSHYPHKCPECGAAAYIGGDLSVDCSGRCRHGGHKSDVTYSGETFVPTTMEIIGLKCVTPPDALPKDKSQQIKGSCAEMPREITSIPTPREIRRDTNDDPRCPTPAEYVGELLRSGSSDLVDQHLKQADSLQPGYGSHVMWKNHQWDVDGLWCQDMAKEIRRRLAPTPFCCDGWKTGEHKVDCQAFPFIPGRPMAEQMATKPKTGLKYSQTWTDGWVNGVKRPMKEVHLNAGQLGLLEEAHEALKISITNDPRDCRRIENLQERISKSLCSIPKDTVQVPREVLEECRKLAHLEYQRIRRGTIPMSGRASDILKKKFHDLWQTLKKLVPLTPDPRKESSL